MSSDADAASHGDNLVLSLFTGYDEKLNIMKTQELEVLEAMLEDPTAWHYSLGVGALVGIPAGTIYPLFAGLEKSGWLESRWDGRETNGLRRRLYRLTGTGQRCATTALSEREDRPVANRPRVGVGVARDGPGPKRRRLGFGRPRARAGFS
jgi:PadR family transcriptional regulator PadR